MARGHKSIYGIAYFDIVSFVSIKLAIYTHFNSLIHGSSTTVYRNYWLTNMVAILAVFAIVLVQGDWTSG